MKEKNLKAAFGVRLRGLRRRRDLTQAEFAELLQCSTEYVSHIERGVGSPSFEMLARLATVLQVDVKALFIFEDEPASKKKK